MSKKCINKKCNNNEVYKDNIALCPRCNNFLKKIDYKKLSDELESTYEDFKFIEKNTNDYINEKSVDNNGNNMNYHFEDFKMKYDKKNKSENYKYINKKKCDNKSNCILIEGRVKKNYEQEIPTFFITKIYRSLFKGLPYIHSNVVNTFHIFENKTLGVEEVIEGKEVILYGKISVGKLTENNIVKIWGKENSNGAIIARKIKNETTNTTIKVNHSVNNLIIWAMVIIISYVLYLLIAFDWQGFFKNILSGINNIVILIIIGLFPLILLFIQIKTIFGDSKKE